MSGRLILTVAGVSRGVCVAERSSSHETTVAEDVYVLVEE